MFGEFETKLTQNSNWILMHIRVYQGLYIAKSENHYKRMVYDKVLKEKLILDINEYNSSDKENSLTYFILEIKSGEETVFIRSNNRLTLEYICYHVIILIIIGISRYWRRKSSRKTSDLLHSPQQL